jgi:hypothetical protein
MQSTKLLFIDGFYYMNNEKVQGKLNLTTYGYIPYSQTDTEEFWFFDGVLLYNEKCYEIVCGLSNKFGLIDPTDYVEGFPETVYCYSPQVFWDSNEEKFIKYERNFNIHFTGTMGIILDQDDTEYNFVKGTLKSRTTYNYLPKKKQLSIFRDKAKEFDNLDVNNEIEKICTLLNYDNNEEKNN